MQTTPVPGTGLQISRLVLGAMTFGDSVDDAAATAMIDEASDAGITMIDTANGYAGGASESMLGRLLAGRRDEFVLATKVGMPNPDADGAAPLSRPAIKACLRGSLRRLATDHVDVYYLHVPDRSTPMRETLETMAELVADGTVGTIGVSNYAAWQLAEMRALCAREGWPAPVVSQPMYNVVARRIEDEYVEYAAQAGLINIVYNPLAGGLLTGKHRPTEPQQGGGRFGASAMGSMYRDRYWHDDVFAAVDVLDKVAQDAGIGIVELALRWLLGRPATDAVLLGASTTHHFTDNLRAAQCGPLPDDVATACDEAWTMLRGAAPIYNR